MQNQILLPILALVIWTLIVLLLIPYRRFSAAFKGEVTAKDFELGESNSVPISVILANRNYMNLLEAPVLFYLSGVLILVTETITDTVMLLAWFYVGLRICHTLVHVSYNNVYHRLFFFAFSNVVLSCIWGMLTFSIIRQV